MAHWIITDHGIGSRYFECSACGSTWNDYYRSVSAEDKCPFCGQVIDNSENEYIGRKPK